MSGKIDSSDYNSSLQIGALRLFVPRSVGYTLGRQGEIFCITILGRKVVAKVATEASSWFPLQRFGVPFVQTQFSLHRYVNELCKCSSAPLRPLNVNEV